MDLELSDDQISLRDELRRFLVKRLDSQALRSCATHPGAVDRGLWKELADMGVFALNLPENDGGVGLGLAEAAIVFEELGRAAVPGPLVASFLAAAFVDGAATGDVVVGAVDAAQPAVVEHLEAIDVLLVLERAAIHRVDSPAGGMLLRPLDPLTPVHRFDELPRGEPVGDAELAERVRRDAALLVAALQVGLGDAAVALGTTHALARMQFGKPVGSFQAVKHLLADAHVWVDVARAGVHAAAVDVDEGEGEGDDASTGATCSVWSARAVASRAAAQATAACVQVHGGMGYTWEVDAHLFLKRAAVLDASFGSTEAALEARASVLVN